MAAKQKHPPKEKPDTETTKEAADRPTDDLPESRKDHELKGLFHWKSPSRPFKKRNRNFYVNLALMLFIIALVALFVQEFLLIATLMAIFFYFYVAGTIEPTSIEHRITNRGITTAEHTYEWEDLEDFWFTKKYNDVLLHVSTKRKFPPRLLLLVPHKEQEKIRTILTEYLTYQETAPITWFDNLIEWFNSKLPASMR